MAMNMGIPFIIVVELCERLGYYTIQGSQKSFLQDNGYSNAKSSSMSQVFGLLSYVTCFLGGWMAETKLGRYKTIGGLVVLYVIGCFLAAIAAHPGISSVPLYLVGVLVLVSLGTGGIKPNVCTFGAEQIDPSSENAESKREAFFMYFYLTINVGAAVALGFLATVATNGLGSFIPQQDGYFGAYLIASIAMALALIAFFAGTPTYRKESMACSTKEDKEDALGLCAKTLWNARGCAMGKVALLGWMLIPVMIVVTVVSAFTDSEFVTMLTLVLDLTCVACLCIAHRDNSWLGENAVSQLLSTIPVIFIGNIVFNIQYNTMTSLFYSQSCQMDTRLGSAADAPQLNGAFFNLGDCIGIIVFTPIIERLCIPFAQKLLGRPVTLNMKIYTGIAIACLSQVVAAILEYARQSAPVYDNIGSLCGPLVEGTDRHVPISGISAWWMMIPYTMIGIGEVLVNPVLQHTAYEGAPENMRSLLQAINLYAMGGLPNAFSEVLTELTAPLVPNNLNDGNLPVVYFVNVAIGVVGCGLYWYFSKAFTASRQVKKVLEPSPCEVSGPSVTV